MLSAIEYIDLALQNVYYHVVSFIYVTILLGMVDILHIPKKLFYYKLVTYTVPRTDTCYCFIIPYRRQYNQPSIVCNSCGHSGAGVIGDLRSESAPVTFSASNCEPVPIAIHHQCSGATPTHTDE